MIRYAEVRTASSYTINGTVSSGYKPNEEIVVALRRVYRLVGEVTAHKADDGHKLLDLNQLVELPSWRPRRSGTRLLASINKAGDSLLMAWSVMVTHTRLMSVVEEVRILSGQPIRR